MAGIFVSQLRKFWKPLVVVLLIGLVLWLLPNKLSDSSQDTRSSAAGKAIRGYEGDFWADVVIGQPSFSETAEWETVSDKVWNPGGVVVDRSSTPNKIYVWDSGNSRVLGFDMEKCLQKNPDKRCQAEIVIGQPDFKTSACNGDSGFQNYPQRAPSSNSTLCGIEESELSPGEGGSTVSMAVDKQGNLYVPDYHNNRVLKYIRPFETDVVADEVWGQENFEGNDPNKGGSLGPDGFRFAPQEDLGPAGVEIDKEGYLWVADNKNNRILRFSPGSKTADLVLGQNNFYSNYKSNSLSGLNHPAAVRVTGVGAEKKVYVADYANGRVLVYEYPFTNGMEGKLFGFGFYRVSGIEIDYQGRGIWVNDTRDSAKGMIELWNNQGTEVIKVIGAGKHIAYNPGDSEYENFSNRFFMENFGSLGISSNDYVCTATRWGDEDRNHNLLCYKIDLSTSATNGVADVKFFSPPEGSNLVSRKEIGAGKAVAILGDQLVLADNGRVLFWNNKDILLDGEPATGVINYSSSNDYIVSTFDSDFRLRNEKYWDSALATDEEDRLYVLDNSKQNPQIIVFQGPLSFGRRPIKIISFPIPFLSGGQFLPTGNFEVGGIAVSKDGNQLWITESDASRVVRIRNPLTNPVADTVIGQDDVLTKGCNKGLYQTDGHWPEPPLNDPSRTESSLCLPGTIALDRSGNLYVSDNSIETRGNKRLMIYSADSVPADGKEMILGVAADHIIERIEPMQPAFDSQNRMVVGFNPFRSALSAGLVSCPSALNEGSCRFVAYYRNPGSAGTVPDGYFADFITQPYSMVFDEDDNLYVADMNRARVLIYKKPLINVEVIEPTATPVAEATPGSKCLRREFGDINCDERINVSDMSLLLEAYVYFIRKNAIPTPGQGRVNPDLTGDGVVDITDVQKLIDNWDVVAE